MANAMLCVCCASWQPSCFECCASWAAPCIVCCASWRPSRAIGSAAKAVGQLCMGGGVDCCILAFVRHWGHLYYEGLGQAISGIVGGGSGMVAFVVPSHWTEAACLVMSACGALKVQRGWAFATLHNLLCSSAKRGVPCVSGQYDDSCAPV